MSIRKRGSQYQVRVRLSGGERHEETLPQGATRKDAETLEITLRTRKIEIASGKAHPTRLIDEVIDRWVRTGARKLKSYDKDLKYKIAELRLYTEGRTLEQLPDIAAAVTAHILGEGLTPATANRYTAVLKRVANLAIKYGWTDAAYGKRMDRVEGEKDRDVFVTVPELNALAEAADRHDIEQKRIAAHVPRGGKDQGRSAIRGGSAGQTGDLIRFAVLTGLRRSEVLRLRPFNIIDGAVVLDSNTKSGKPRVVPLPAQALEIAHKRLPFTIKPSTITERYNAAREAIGRPNLTLRDLRHAYAKSVLKAGGLPHALQALLGHSSLAVTSKYVSTDRPDLKLATQGLRL